METILSDVRADKKKIKMHKTIWLIIWTVSVVAAVCLTVFYVYAFPLFLLLVLFISCFFISAMSLSCRAYEYNGNIITVYAGSSHHYLKVNGKIMDEYTAFFRNSPIYLSTNLPDGTYLQATITTMNRVSLKINNVLYTVEIKNP